MIITMKVNLDDDKSKLMCADFYDAAIKRYNSECDRKERARVELLRLPIVVVNVDLLRLLSRPFLRLGQETLQIFRRQLVPIRFNAALDCARHEYEPSFFKEQLECWPSAMPMDKSLRAYTAEYNKWKQREQAFLVAWEKKKDQDQQIVRNPWLMEKIQDAIRNAER